MRLLPLLRHMYHRTRQAAGEFRLFLLDSSVSRTPTSSGGGVLLVRVDAIGDYMLFRQCLRGLRRAPCFQGKKITLCGNAAWKPLAEALDADCFDAFVPVERARFLTDGAYRQELLRSIRARGFDCALQPTFSREYVGDSIIRASGAARRVGFASPAQNMPWVVKCAFDRCYTELVRPASGFPFELSRNAEMIAYLNVAHENIPPFRNVFPERLKPEIRQQYLPLLGLPVFFLGASVADKRWPKEYFVDLAEFVCGRYGGPVLLLGGGDVAGDMDFITSRSHGKAIPVPRTSLVEMAALIAGASLLVSNDSAGAHIGATYGVPTVTIANGQHHGRFLPYPETVAPRTRTVYPEAMTPEEHRYYNKKSPHTAADVSLEAVEEAVSQLCG